MENIEDRIEVLHQKARDLLASGKDDNSIVSELSGMGIEKSYAAMILENVRGDIHDRKEFWKHMGMGSFFLGGGILLNYLSYTASSNAGALSYILFWGVIVAGIIVLIRGFILFRK